MIILVPGSRQNSFMGSRPSKVTTMIPHNDTKTGWFEEADSPTSLQLI